MADNKGTKEKEVNLEDKVADMAIGMSLMAQGCMELTDILERVDLQTQELQKRIEDLEQTQRER